MAWVGRVMVWLLLAAGAPGSALDSAQGQAVATILQSGSTNTRGYAVTVYGDGSAKAVLNADVDPAEATADEPQSFPAGSVDAGRLQGLLTRIGDVSSIPTGGCAKSVSFGTRTQIEYRNKTSGDLQCVRGAMGGTSGGTPEGTPEAVVRAAGELSQFVQEMLNRLKVRNHRSGFRKVP